MTMLLAASVTSAADQAKLVDPVADAEAQYRVVLEVIKKPSITGVLVTEILPDSAAGAAGLRAGDIITSYYGEKIADLKTLREQVSDCIAHALTGDAEGRVVLRARRILPSGQPDEVVMQVPREPLGIRGVEVESGVPGPRNPPAAPRGKLLLDWPAVLTTLRADEQAVFRTSAEVPPVATQPASSRPVEAWLGWQRYAYQPDPAGDALGASLEVHRVEADSPDREEQFEMRLRLGDNQLLPPFLLDLATASYPARQSSSHPTAMAQATARRAGDLLRIDLPAPSNAPDGRPAAADHREYTVPLDSIIQPALPLVAAALPHAANAVLGLHLLSVRDFVPRPGYVLATKGLQPLPPQPGEFQTVPRSADRAKGEQAWRVDLMHFGMVLESYWFSDQRRLLAIAGEGATGGSGPPVISRRVDDPADARQFPSTRPALPAPPSPP